MNKIIKKSIEDIVPENGAEERMYRNILRKAEREKSHSGKIIYTRFAAAACIVTAIAAIYAVRTNDDISEPIESMPSESVTAISTESNYTDSSDNLPPANDNDERGGLMAVNPFAQEYTIEDIRNWGIECVLPENADEETFTIYDDELAEVRFVLDGHAFNYTFSDKGGDLSGIYDETENIQSIDGDNGTLETTKSGYYKAFWNGEKYFYCLSNTDGADESSIIQIAKYFMEQAQ